MRHEPCWCPMIRRLVYLLNPNGFFMHKAQDHADQARFCKKYTLFREFVRDLAETEAARRRVFFGGVGMAMGDPNLMLGTQIFKRFRNSFAQFTHFSPPRASTFLEYHKVYFCNTIDLYLHKLYNITIETEAKISPRRAKMIGLSVHLCIKDIVNGIVSLNEVEKIVGATAARPPEEWIGIVLHYGAHCW